MNSTMLPAGVEDGPALLTDAANPSSLTAELPTTTRTDEPTLASTWLGVAGTAITDELLEWPADLFALSDVLLERAESYRLVFSAPDGGRWPPSRFSPSEETTWPPGRFANWSNAVEAAAREWCVWAEDHTSPFPALLAEAWSTVLERASMPLEQLAQGRDWRICEALLIAAYDRGRGVRGPVRRSGPLGWTGMHVSRPGAGAAWRGQVRWPASAFAFVRVLPKVSTPRDGGATSPATRASIARLRHPLAQAARPSSRHRPPAEHVNVLMLPWPLRVRESDFRAVKGSVSKGWPRSRSGCLSSHRPRSGSISIWLIALWSPRGTRSDSVDVVVLPESAVEESETRRARRRCWIATE